MNRNDTGASRLVFQYGSNCLEAQINGKDRLKGDARFIGIAETVDDYELAFDVFSKGRHCAAADIVRKPGGKVWGALYEIPEYLIGRATAGAHDRKSLDAIEGAGSNYERQDIDVRTAEGKFVRALTYTVINPCPGLKTDIDYARYIIAGLRERGIPGDYVEKVKRIAVANNPSLASQLQRL
jgi:gamma-glutamylcyclotransferase